MRSLTAMEQLGSNFNLITLALKISFPTVDLMNQKAFRLTSRLCRRKYAAYLRRQIFTHWFG